MNNNDLRSFNILKKFKLVSLVNALIIFKDSGFKGLRRKIKERKIAKKRQKDSTFVEENLIKPKFKIGYIDVIIARDVNCEKIINELQNSKYNYNYFSFGKTVSDNCQTINEFTLEKLFSLRSFIYISQKQKCEFEYAVHIIYESNSIKKLIENAIENPTNVKLLANYNETNNISVKAATFFDYAGTNYYSGGAERYLIDLHNICKKMNLNLNIYQNAETPFFRKYNGINVIGMKAKDIPLEYNFTYFDNQTHNYIYQTCYNTKLHIYSAFQECYPNHIGPSIGISHGVSWDHKFNKVIDAQNFWNDKLIFIESAKLCNKLVSVDTNTANWFQTVDYEIGNKKFNVISNYVDTKEFVPRKDYDKKRDKIVITYPRRLYEPRGLYIVLDIVDKILNKYKNVEFHFVGKGFDEDVNNIKKKISDYPDRIFCYSKSPYEMHEVYKNTDISLVPTQYSEGTSLSCLEAMSSGNIVVCTRIGGLTDLILNNYNGYLIEPDSNSLLHTLENIIDNYDKQNIIKKRAIETAESFNKERWEKAWTEIINEFNIKGQSSNNDLIECYVKDANNISPKMMKVIKEELIKGNLTYVKSDLNQSDFPQSYGLLQYLKYNDERVSIPQKIYMEKEAKKPKIEGEIIEL